MKQLRHYINLKILSLVVFVLFSAFAKAYTTYDPCALLTSPVPGATDVGVTETIFFEDIPGAVSYFVDLGTTPGGIDILNNYNAGSTPQFTAPQGFPESTLIYITIRGFFPSGNTVSCDAQFFTTEDNTLPPGCTEVVSPINGAVDVSVSTSISWSYAPRATGYIINIGTSPGATDIINGQDLGNTLTFTPPFDLESDTTYYITIIPYNENGQVTTCTETSFTTEVIASEIPECTQLFSPIDGAIEVALTPLLEWFPVDNVEGYLIKIGSTPDGDDVLANTNIGLTTSTPVIDFEEGVTYYVTITPFNAAGQAQNCTQTSFTTTLGCGPYTDGITGEMVDLNPVINLEDSYEICEEQSPLQLSYPDPYESIFWYEIIEGQQQLLSSDPNIAITQTGTYLLEVNEEAMVEAGFVICTATHMFDVTISTAPVISNLVISNQGATASVLVELEGEGNFEFASGNPAGPYQASPLLQNINPLDIQVYVRDIGGCGMDSRVIRPDPGFPKYFTPNGDGINDTWQVRGVVVNGETVTSIEIYDRYGKRLKTILPYGLGWDGTYHGRQLLDSGFWYKANTASNVIFTGYFALRRQ
ncbi:T9SS type B sorting domain-containing protein [Dokdonia donghaensis]|uniref:T9SS type B sorting domain-containing protein n=1 Tax=Dokdonia donghaensis TaxID=326320 RepID=UPI0009DE17EB|nr:T9SS type B sorting domain-containing protein [Dokdonia donghaensis]